MSLEFNVRGESDERKGSFVLLVKKRPEQVNGSPPAKGSSVPTGGPSRTPANDQQRWNEEWEYFTRLWPLKLATLLWFVAILGASVYGLAATWSDWWPIPQLDILELRRVKPALYASFAGVVGATVYALRGFYHALGPPNPKRPKYDPNWTWWYASRPILGAFLGFTSFAILRAGVGTLGTSQQDGTAITGYLSVGLLSGFSASSVFDWLERIAAQLFGGDQSPGGA